MSGEVSFIQAVYNRLADPTLISLAPGGVWLIHVPYLDEFRRVTVNGGSYVFHDDTLSQPTWVEFNVQAGGTYDFAPPEEWKDFWIRIVAKTMDSPKAAIDADERIDQLVTGWTPLVTGWSNVWTVTRVEDLRNAWFEEAPVERYIWLAGGNYRFRGGRIP